MLIFSSFWSNLTKITVLKKYICETFLPSWHMIISSPNVTPFPP